MLQIRHRKVLETLRHCSHRCNLGDRHCSPKLPYMSDSYRDPRFLSFKILSISRSRYTPMAGMPCPKPIRCVLLNADDLKCADHLLHGVRCIDNDEPRRNRKSGATEFYPLFTGENAVYVLRMDRQQRYRESFVASHSLPFSFSLVIDCGTPATPPLAMSSPKATGGCSVSDCLKRIASTSREHIFSMSL